MGIAESQKETFYRIFAWCFEFTDYCHVKYQSLSHPLLTCVTLEGQSPIWSVPTLTLLSG